MNPRRGKASTGSLHVVGVGINGPPQTTLEAVECMRSADRLFYLVGEPTTEMWLQMLNPNATSLADLYREGKPRHKTYREMRDRLLESVRSGQRVCAAFYGHPGVLVMSSHWAISLARREGYPARMLPGVAADACLFADLGVNPGDSGVQSFEATDFLIARRRFDPTSHLILWQIGVLGEPSVRKGMTSRPERLRTLVERLRRFYPGSHRITLYLAPIFAAERPLTQRLRLDRLERTTVSAIATLSIPPLPQRKPDSRILRWYDEE